VEDIYNLLPSVLFTSTLVHNGEQFAFELAAGPQVSGTAHELPPNGTMIEAASLD
jgi:hypothetical protein